MATISPHIGAETIPATSHLVAGHPLVKLGALSLEGFFFRPAVPIRFPLHDDVVKLKHIVSGLLLARCADMIAEGTGLGRLLIGSLLLAGATSLPELMVGANAIRLGQPDLAVGDLLGGGLFNLLTLSVIDSIFRHPVSTFSSQFAHHSRTGILSIHLTGLVGAGIASGTGFSIAGVGLFIWIIAGAYLLGMKLTFEATIAESAAAPRAEAPGRVRNPRRLLNAGLGFAAGTAGILIAAPELTSGKGVGWSPTSDCSMAGGPGEPQALVTRAHAPSSGNPTHRGNMGKPNLDGIVSPSTGAQNRVSGATSFRPLHHARANELASRFSPKPAIVLARRPFR